MRPQVLNNEANVGEVLNTRIRMPIPEALRVGLDERRRLRQQLAHRDHLYRFDFGCGVHAVTLLAATPGFKRRFAFAPSGPDRAGAGEHGHAVVEHAQAATPPRFVKATSHGSQRT